jgi:hypothetical protein
MAAAEDIAAVLETMTSALSVAPALSVIVMRTV